MRLIDADAIPYTMLYKENWMGCTGIEEQGVWKGTIDAMPTIEPEIIRCKDCKYYVIHTLFGRSHGWCERLCDEFDKSLARGVEPDDYCSRAERREE